MEDGARHDNRYDVTILVNGLPAPVPERVQAVLKYPDFPRLRSKFSPQAEREPDQALFQCFLLNNSELFP